MDIFSIIIITFIVLFLGGISYMIYFPFKKRLIKSGKLSEKQSNQINRGLFILLLLLGIVLYYFKDYRTHSKNRLEDVSDINLPRSYEVIKDEYQEGLQGYCIFYEIQFDSNSIKELINSIKKSKYYKANFFHNRDYPENVWHPSAKGYNLNTEKGVTTYRVEVDTIIRILKYSECAD